MRQLLASAIEQDILLLLDYYSCSLYYWFTDVWILKHELVCVSKLRRQSRSNCKARNVSRERGAAEIIFYVFLLSISNLAIRLFFSPGTRKINTKEQKPAHQTAKHDQHHQTKSFEDQLVDCPTYIVEAEEPCLARKFPYMHSIPIMLKLFVSKPKNKTCF